MEINANGEEVEIADIVASQAVIPQESPSSLPKTGRSLPLLALIDTWSGKLRRTHRWHGAAVLFWL
jgi:hypothetical protein